MILVIDNYDSFTYNLVQYIGELGEEMQVVRNDRLDERMLARLAPSHIVISPGPGTPDESGRSLDVLRAATASTPILGVCLGHQCIGQVFGASVVPAQRLMHGKTSPVRHDGKGLFAGLPNPFTATRYHSLCVVEETLPPDVEACAWAEDDGVLMGVRHRRLPIHGVQFHPESILTVDGKDLLRNFLKMGRAAASVELLS